MIPTNYAYILAHIIVGRVFANGPRDWGSIPVWIIPKTQKWYLMPTCLTLSIVNYRSRVSGAIQRHDLGPPLHLGIVAIEKELFMLPSTTVVSQNIYIYIYIYIYICWKINGRKNILVMEENLFSFADTCFDLNILPEDKFFYLKLF